MLIRMANRQDPDQTASEQSDLGLPCLSRLLSRQLVFEILEHLQYCSRFTLQSFLPFTPYAIFRTLHHFL